MSAVLDAIVEGLTSDERQQLQDAVDQLAVDPDAAPEPGMSPKAQGALKSLRDLLRGVMEDKKDNLPQSSDCYYIWTAEGVTFENLRVIKVGVTTSGRGMSRIEEVAKESGMTPVDVMIFQTEFPFIVERGLLNALPLIPPLEKFNGRTEFRACSEDTYAMLVGFASVCGTLVHQYPTEIQQ